MLSIKQVLRHCFDNGKNFWDNFDFVEDHKKKLTILILVHLWDHDDDKVDNRDEADSAHPERKTKEINKSQNLPPFTVYVLYRSPRNRVQ